MCQMQGHKHALRELLGWPASARSSGSLSRPTIRPPTQRDFVPVGRRWGVERSFAWLACFRRLARDYEYRSGSHAAWVLLANCTICLNRIQ